MDGTRGRAEQNLLNKNVLAPRPAPTRRNRPIRQAVHRRHRTGTGLTRCRGEIGLTGTKERLDGLIFTGCRRLLPCRSRRCGLYLPGEGLFRKDKRVPVAGDRVGIAVDGDGTGVIEVLRERRNMLVRPPVANLDLLAVVASVTDPSPNTLVMDKMIALAEINGIEPVIVITKTDLKAPDALEEIYRRAGFAVFVVSAQPPNPSSRCAGPFWQAICLYGEFGRRQVQPAQSAGSPPVQGNRGNQQKTRPRPPHHRTTVLYRQPGGGYIADTPGFSSIEFERTQMIRKEALSGVFPGVRRLFWKVPVRFLYPYGRGTAAPWDRPCGRGGSRPPV